MGTADSSVCATARLASDPADDRTTDQDEPPSKKPTGEIPEPTATEEPKPEPAKEPAEKGKDKEEHFDMTEVAPVVTHHQITVDGKLLHYTATAGRLPH